MSRTEAYEDIIDDENNTQDDVTPTQKQHQPKFKTHQDKLQGLVTEFVEAYEDWEKNAYGSGRVIQATRLPNWEALGRKYYDIYLKAKRFAK